MLKRILGAIGCYGLNEVETSASTITSAETPNPSSQTRSGTRNANAGSSMRQALLAQVSASNANEKPVPLATPGATFGTVALAAAETYGTLFPADSSFVKIASIGNMTPLDDGMRMVTNYVQGFFDKNNRPSFSIAVPTAKNAPREDTKNSATGISLVLDRNQVVAEIQGLHAIARHDPSSKELIVAYRGTVPVHPANLIQDVQLAFLHPPTQILDPATLFAQQTVDQLKAQGKPVETVILTGHSLGGYIAQSVAADLRRDEGIKIVELAFDAPGGPPKVWLKTLDVQATNVSAEKDPVNGFGDIPIGKSITFGDPPSGWEVLQPLVQHMLSQILKPLSEQPALANLHIAKLNEQSEESLATLSSISADEYKKMSLEQRKNLAEGNMEDIMTTANENVQELETLLET
jgi:pimeloyl-ACP methyl ester carboxylesterase